MKDIEELMAIFGEGENSCTVSSKVHERQKNVKKHEKLKTKKGFFSYERKKERVLKRIEAKVKRQQENLKDKSILEKVRVNKNTLKKEIIDDKNEKMVGEHTRKTEGHLNQEKKEMSKKLALKKERERVAKLVKEARTEKIKKQKQEKNEQRRFERKIKETEKAIKIIADEETRKAKKEFNRITEPNKKRNIFNRLGNIINLNQKEYDIYKDYINDYRKGKVSKEELELEWEEIQDYEDAKSDVKLRNAWKAFKLALVGAGLAATVHFGGKVLKSAYEFGYNFSSGFWDETKKDLKEQREEYEIKYGDTFPNGEKKKELTEEEYKQFNIKKPKDTTYIPSIDAEFTEGEDGNIKVILPNGSGKRSDNITHEKDTKDLER